MKFKEYNSIILAEGVTQKDFINQVKKYLSIDNALKYLQDEYIEWYLLNINNKKLQKELKSSNLQEEELTTGYAPEPYKIRKNIKYKGQYITVSYDPELGTWFPTIRFRSIVSALKYIKRTVDYQEQDVWHL